MRRGVVRALAAGGELIPPTTAGKPTTNTGPHPTRTFRSLLAETEARRPLVPVRTLAYPSARRDDTPQVAKVRGLLDLAGIGMSGSWLLGYELLVHRPNGPSGTDRSSSQAILRWLTARQAKPPVPERRERRDPKEAGEPNQLRGAFFRRRDCRSLG
jgi:hypothetical protein